MDLVGRDGRHRDGQVGPAADMELHELPVIHAVEMVAGEDQHQVALVLDEIQVLPHRVGGALVPVAALQRLLGREQGDEILVERVEPVGQEDMAVQRFAGELGQDEDAAVVRMDAVADGNVDEPEPPGDGDGRLAADLGQGKEPAPLSPGHDEGNNLLHDALPRPTTIPGLV